MSPSPRGCSARPGAWTQHIGFSGFHLERLVSVGGGAFKASNMSRDVKSRVNSHVNHVTSYSLKGLVAG